MATNPYSIDHPSCTLGNLASYVVNVTTDNQVAASVKFAAKYSLRFRVKNSGHGYSGKFTEAGAFTVWTYYLQGVQLIKNFVPQNCKPNAVDPINVFLAGSGVNVGGLVNASAGFDRVSIGGYTSTVDAMGGSVLGVALVRLLFSLVVARTDTSSPRSSRSRHRCSCEQYVYVVFISHSAN